jgi:hypothetical protein
MNINPKLVEYVIENFDNKDSDVRAILDCMKVTLRRHSKNCKSQKRADFLDTLVDQIETPDFWDTLDWANNFAFEGP